MRCHSWKWAVLIAFGCGSSGNSADPLAWIPADVNAVARINVAEIYQTPLAKNEGWLKKATESFIQQEAFIPPGTKQVVIGAELDLSDNLLAQRKFSVLVPDGQLTLEKLSPWLSGDPETVSGKTIARFGSDAYLADGGDDCWITSSASRQAVLRWLKSGPTPGGTQLSRYLRSALNSKENKAQVLLAIDLQDNFSRQRIIDELKSTDWFKSDVVLESTARILESIQGLTIGITVEKDRTGFVTIDFGTEATALKPIVEKLILAAVQRVGVSTDDIQDWQWNAKGNQITGTGTVSQGGARRLLSILDPPSITQAISASSVAPLSPEVRMAKTSHKYFKSVQVLLDDLRETLKKTNDHHALYFERYARKIDDLPKLNVDSQLLDFTAKVSSSLRYQSQAQRMHNINAGTRTMQTYASSSSYVGPYGSYSTMPNAGVAVAISAEEGQAAKGVRFSEWKQIEDGLVAVRRVMTEKYQIEF